METVAIIPARGGSKGIPRKCVRPLAGRPLIAYAIDACRNCRGIDRVIVTTDDPEIAMLSERFGAHVVMRPAALANDATPLDPVVVHAVDAAEQEFGVRFELVVTVQPTSPLVTAADIERAIELLRSPEQPDTVLTVMDDRHLAWTLREGVPVPAYQARVNRQQLEPRFRETGAVIACRREQLRAGSRIGRRIRLIELPATRSVDIDTFEDLFVCESILTRKRIVFAVTGFAAVGLGHAFRAIMLANELVKHELHFVCEHRSELAAETIRARNYAVDMCPNGGLLDAVLALKPDLVINDILDTDAEYVRSLKASGCLVVNFEDLGAGSDHADLVINALYDDEPQRHSHLAGPEYFCLRDEFLYLPDRQPRPTVERVLVTFGGTDENNLAARIIELLAPVCRPRGIAIDVVVGPGFRHGRELDEAVRRCGADAVHVAGSTSRISDFMMTADLALTSGGRTVLELASLRVPTLVICQNERELTHRFASAENGVLNLGLHDAVPPETIVASFLRLVDDREVREAMRERMGRWDLTKGKRRVTKSVVSLFD